MHHIDWPEHEGTEYGLSHGDWLRLLRRHGFEVLDLIELYPTPGAERHDYYDHVPPEWADQWPAEELWVARLRA
jgi:hypothetical protein